MSEEKLAVSHSGHSPCPGCFDQNAREDALESSLAQAKADVEALRKVDETAEALILSIGYPKDRLLVARYTSAKAALPEHLRRDWRLSENDLEVHL